MKDALPNLKASLDRARAIAADIDAHAPDALRDAGIQARHETTLCATAVILSGFFESFLREIAEEMIADICSRAIPFDQLPSSVRITHYWDGALHLRHLAREDKGDNPLVFTRATNAARRLASVSGPQVPYEILWEAFATTQANPGSKEISSYLKRFGVNDPIPTLAGAMSVSDGMLTLRLNSFIEIRNECAHTGTAKNIPTSSDVREYCDLIQSLGEGILAVFQNVLDAPPYAAAPAAAVPIP